MLTGIIIYLALYICFMGYLMHKAPLGYEDKEGFHYKREK